MNNRDIDLLNHLRALSSETCWVEFKHNNTDPEGLGKRVSALANAARLDGEHLAYLVWGIEDATHAVVGTTFQPGLYKIGNEIIEFWLAKQLTPSPALSFRDVQHPSGRVVLLEIPAATGAPVAFKGVPYIRIGSTTPALSDYPERYRALIEALRPFAWEQSIAANYLQTELVFQLLDYPSYFRLTKQRLPDNRDGILERLQAERLITPDVGGRWSISNLGAILFAVDLSAFAPALARKAMRVVRFEGVSKTANASYRHDSKAGYASGFESLVEMVNGLLPQKESIGPALRTETPLFPTLAIRELVANALIHQDMTISGAGPRIEIFKDRVEITNPGKPLIATDRMIDLPPRSRNEALAALMRRMGLCEEEGNGLDRVLEQVEIAQLPAPLFRDSEDSLQVILYGPRGFAQMTPEERVRACYQHAVLKWLAGDRMKNASLCERFGVEKKNAAQASNVFKQALAQHLIKLADAEHHRAGYIPIWA